MIYFTILMIYYSSDSPSSLITLSLSVTQSLIHTRRVNRITVKALVTSNIIQSVCLVGKGRLKERCGLEPRTNIFFSLRNRQKLVRIRFENIRYCLLITSVPTYTMLVILKKKWYILAKYQNMWTLHSEETQKKVTPCSTTMMKTWNVLH